MDGILRVLLDARNGRAKIREAAERAGFTKIHSGETSRWELKFNDWGVVDINSLVLVGYDKDLDKTAGDYIPFYEEKDSDDSVSVYTLPLEKAIKKLAGPTKKVKASGGEMEVPYRFPNTSFVASPFFSSRLVLWSSVERYITIPMTLANPVYLSGNNKQKRKELRKVMGKVTGYRWFGRLPDISEITMPFTMFAGKGRQDIEYFITNKHLMQVLLAQKRCSMDLANDIEYMSRVARAEEFERNYEPLLKIG